MRVAVCTAIIFKDVKKQDLGVQVSIYFGFMLEHLM